jgi:ferredoxin
MTQTKITSEIIKQRALALGADAVGIGNIDRWKEAPLQMDPKQIMPECKSIIGFVFRVMRGSLRGIEEGTFFSNYSSMGYGGITYLFMPMVVMNLARMIEDAGYEAIPMGHQSDWRGIDNEGDRRMGYSVPVRPGHAAPDVMLHLRIGAFLCGLGEIGFSKMFLSPQFGPRNRVGLLLTDLELEPDPLYNGQPLCNRCMACVANCPGQAIKKDKTVKTVAGGAELEWSDIDCKACDVAMRGGRAIEHGEEGFYTEEMYGNKITSSKYSPFVKKPTNLYNVGQAVCGGRGCVRACMVNLENNNALTNKFASKFRREPLWTVDWSEPTNQAIAQEGKHIGPVSLSNASVGNVKAKVGAVQTPPSIPKSQFKEAD